MSAIPVLNVTAAGAVPTPIDTLRTDLINAIAATNPDYTANLPLSLIEDISSTDTVTLSMIDQARVDAVNSLSPVSMGSYILSQFGQQTGIPQGQPSNTSAYVVFTGPVGQVIQPGFLVSDGTNQYALQTGGVIASNGQSSPLYVVATNSGSFTPAANSITTIVTSLPSGVTLTVTNPLAGTAGGPAELPTSYRSRLLEANKVTTLGVATLIKASLKTVPGVNPRLVSVLQVSGGWEVLCGGGDPYQVAGAIYAATLDLSSIIGSTIVARNISVSIVDSPNSYTVTFVNPPAQTVTGTVTWNTSLGNFTAGIQVNQLAQVALTSYLNSIIAGQPINELEMIADFQEAVSSLIDSNDISSLIFSILINGVVTPPNAGTSIIPGDPESYFLASSTGLVVQQG